MNQEEHRLVRELLGAFALDQLTDDERTVIGTHLDSCAACRGELASIASLAAPLKLVDVARLDLAPTPPPRLEEDILRRIRAGRRQPAKPLLRWAVPLVAAALAALAGIGVGYRAAPRPPAIPLEAVAVGPAAPGITSTAGVVPHKWGMEIKLTAHGFAAGTVYRVMVTDKAGARVSAGAFIGTGVKEMRCNLNSSVRRADATGFEVLDPAGRTVLSSRL